MWYMLVYQLIKILQKHTQTQTCEVHCYNVIVKDCYGTYLVMVFCNDTTPPSSLGKGNDLYRLSWGSQLTTFFMDHPRESRGHSDSVNNSEWSQWHTFMNTSLFLTCRSLKFLNLGLNGRFSSWVHVSLASF